MAPEGLPQELLLVMHRINRAWLDSQLEQLGPLLHADIVMVFPGFGGRIQGKEAFLAGFRDFCKSAAIQDFKDRDYQVDIAGNTAVVTFQFEMVYERAGERFRSTGRDFWVYERSLDNWLAVWRTMLDVTEIPA